VHPALACYAVRVGRELLQLPKGWEEPISEDTWPSALISAIRQDVGALASPRVIETLRQWQALAQDDSQAELRLRAQSRLQAVGRALAGEPGTDELLATFDPNPAPTERPHAAPMPESGTIDAFGLPPKPRLRRQPAAPALAEAPVPAAPSQARPAPAPAAPSQARSAAPPPRARRVSLPPTEEEGDTDARVLVQKPRTGASAPPESAFSEENPTTAFMFAEDQVGPPPPLPPPLPKEAMSATPRGPTPRVRIPSHQLKPPVTGAPFVFEEDDKPTRHIALPEEILMRRVDSAQAALVDSEPERTQMATFPPKPAAPPRGVTPKVHVLESARAKKVESGRLAPKPGVIRRSSHGARKTSSPRPRAAMHHVRTLHGLLLRFVEELVPLSYERRSRRFWARWREVAGDRGVRREFVEELLKTATDTRTLICELIAEMQSADPGSVYQLVDKLGVETPHLASQPVDSPSEPLPELLGASVRVDPEDG